MDEPIDSQSLKIPIFIPKSQLDEYINCNSNIDIYQTLKILDIDDDSILEYFNNLYHEFYIILANLESPTKLINHIQKLDLKKEELFFNLQDLIIAITFSNEYSQQPYRAKLNIILDLIVEVIFDIGEELFTEIYGDGVEREFRRIVSYSNSDVDNQTQLKELINKKTGLQQNGIMYGPHANNKKLLRIIDLEIARIESLIKYSNENIKNSNSLNAGDLTSRNITSDIESMELLKAPDLQLSELANEIQSEENDKPKLKLKQIALICIYKGTNITRENCNSIANQYGYISGEKLYQYFNKYYRFNDRIGTEDTKLKTKNKIEQIESIIEFLPKDKQNKALEEIAIMKTKLKEFQ